MSTASFVTPSTGKEVRNFLVIGTLMSFLVAAVLLPELFTPYLSTGALRYIKWITLPVLAVHLLEYFFVVHPLLTSQNASSSIKLVYFVLTFIIGFPSWMPLKRVIADSKKKTN